MTIFEKISDSHERIITLFDVIDTLDQVELNSIEVKKLFKSLQACVLSHSRAEEMSLYDVLKTFSETHTLGFVGDEEHHVFDLIMDEMMMLDPTDARWKAKFIVLRDFLEHHIAEEEEINFTILKKIFPKAKQKELGRVFEAERQKILHSISQ